MKLVKIEMCASSLEVGKHYIWVVDEWFPTTVTLNKTGDGIDDVRNGGEWFFENALIGELYEVVMEDKSSSPSNLAPTMPVEEALEIDRYINRLVRKICDETFSDPVYDYLMEHLERLLRIREQHLDYAIQMS